MKLIESIISAYTEVGEDGIDEGEPSRLVGDVRCCEARFGDFVSLTSPVFEVICLKSMGGTGGELRVDETVASKI